MKKLFITVLLITPIICAATGNKPFGDDAVLGDGIFPSSRTIQRFKTTNPPPRAATPYRTATDEIKWLFPISTGTNATGITLVEGLDPIGYAPTSKAPYVECKPSPPVAHDGIMSGDLSLMNTEGRMPYEEVEALTEEARSVLAATGDLAELLILEEGLRTPEYSESNHQKQANAKKK